MSDPTSKANLKSMFIMKHPHKQYSTLERIGKNAQGKMTYDGATVAMTSELSAAGPQIDDVTPAIDKVYSSDKVVDLLADKSDTTHNHSGTYEPVDANIVRKVGGVIPIEAIPPAALERLVVVANQTARFALTTATVQLGDTVKQTDTGDMYYVVSETNLANAAGYRVYTAGTASAVAWTGVTSKPAPVTALLGTNTGDETVTRIGTLASGATSKTAPIDADTLLIRDSVTGNMQVVTMAYLREMLGKNNSESAVLMAQSFS